MLPIHEQFYTFQGEGIHAGRAAYFIRTFGCPVHCPWCDSAGTWHPDYIPKNIDRLTPETLAKGVAETKAEFAVITGGEPTIHNLGPLSDALHANQCAVHLETSGAFPIKGSVDWITLSPKRWKHPLRDNVAQADEFKIIVDSIESIEEYSELLASLGADPQTPIWLHPEWSKHSDQALLNTITEWIKAKGSPFRAGWQMHKNYAADLTDSRSATAAPLGGKPTLGY